MRAGPAAATMQAFLAAWLDELSWTDSLRLGAACRRAREALGAGGVAAAAFAVTRPWRAEPEASLRLWRRAWEACASASSALGLRGGAWLKTGTVIPAAHYSNAAVTLDLECAREVANHVIRMRMLRTPLPLIAILLISGERAAIHSEEFIADCDAHVVVQLHMLLLLSPLPLARPVFAGASAFAPELMELADNPLDVCGTVIADGLDTCLLVPQRAQKRSAGQIIWAREFWLRVKTLSSGMKRVARDGRAYDLRLR